MNFESWPIVRSKPVAKTYGRSISLFINNWQCHLTTVDVYEDGSVECWGFVDLELFEGKLRSNWVVPAPKTDQTLSVYNFGFTCPKNGNWGQTSHSIAKEVDSVVRSLNPGMRNLLNMEGSDTEVRGKVRYAKLGLSDKKPYRKHEGTGEDILGDSVPVLCVAEDGFELTRLVVYADGMCGIGSVGELIPVGGLNSLYERGQISNLAPANSRVRLPGLGEFQTATDFGHVSVSDRLAEVYDKIAELNGNPSVISICAKFFTEYQHDPSPQAKAVLRDAYEAVPKHLRCYCGDMDTRDTAIRDVLYGKDHGE